MINNQDVGKITSSLYIGGVRLAQQPDWLLGEGIKHVLKLYPGDPQWPEGFSVLELPMEDGVHLSVPVLHQGASYIREIIESGRKILVVCGIGVSRSATFVLAYLLEQGHDLHDAFLILHAGRPEAWPAQQMWESLIVHYKLTYSLRDIYKWKKLISATHERDLPSREEVRRVFLGLIQGSIGREEAADWAAEYIRQQEAKDFAAIRDQQIDASELDFTDYAVWNALELLSAADLKTIDRPYLFEEVDFRAWYDEFEEQVAGDPR